MIGLGGDVAVLGGDLDRELDGDVADLGDGLDGELGGS